MQLPGGSRRCHGRSGKTKAAFLWMRDVIIALARLAVYQGKCFLKRLKTFPGYNDKSNEAGTRYTMFLYYQGVPYIYLHLPK